MRQITIWKNRLNKFCDHPQAVIPFLKKYIYYNFVADSYIKYYKNIKFLDYQQTINYLIDNDTSFVRFGDEAFDMVQGIGLYFNGWRQPYSPSLSGRYKEVLASNNPKLLVGFNPELILMSKKDFKDNLIPEQYQYWVNSKVFLREYINAEQIYGSALCFHENYNSQIDYNKILLYFKSKHLVVIGSKINRFKAANVGLTTTYIEGPGSDAWSEYDNLIVKVREIAVRYPKDKVLVLSSLGPATKVMVYDLTLEGFTVWDTGQLFDLALEKFIKN